MREILFRGKRIDNGEWVEGSLVTKLDVDACCVSTCEIIEKTDYTISCDYDTRFRDLEPISVDENSVGQYTGLRNRNGERFFEGDVVRCEEGRVCEVVYFTSPGIASFDMKPIAGFDKPYPKLWNLFSGSEVIGNINDNPELLKEDEKDENA